MTDYESAYSETSSDSEDENFTTFYEENSNEFDKIGQIVGFLKKYSPKKKVKTRSKKDIGANRVCQHDELPVSQMIDSIETLQNLVRRLGMRINDISKENIALKTKLDNLSNPPNKSRDPQSQSTVSTAQVSPQAARNAPIRENTPNTDTKYVDNMNSRIERLEQQSLMPCIILGGTKVEKMIQEVVSDNPNSTTSTAPTIKSSTLDMINTITQKNPLDYSVEEVSIMGRDKKSLKIRCSEAKHRTQLIIDIKRSKPHEIYASEFLTKSRSETLFKLRSLKRIYPDDIDAVYSRNGVIYCKLTGQTRSITLPDVVAVNKLEVKILNRS